MNTSINFGDILTQRLKKQYSLTLARGVVKNPPWEILQGG